MQSKAATVAQYLAELPADRRAAIEAVRKVILKNLDKKGYAEGMQYGMIGYFVPHSVYPPGYHCDPRQGLPFAALASQKNYMAVYLNGIYSDPATLKWFLDAWSASGKKKPDMGKCCVRFKSLEDIPLEVIGEVIKRTPAKDLIAHYESARDAPREKGPPTKRKAPATKKPASGKKASANETAKKAAKKPAKKKARAKA